MIEMVRPLQNSRVGISISESPDLDQLGLSTLHLQDAMTRIARHVLAAGGTLVYGGDLRSGGFTDTLFEFAATYKQPKATRLSVENVLAWPVHVSIDRQQLVSVIAAFEPFGSMIFLNLSGAQISKEHALREARRSPSVKQWSSGLTNMRKFLASKCDARILIGGRVSDYRGAMPGIAEEALMSIRYGKPTYLVGGFGGCARNILEAIGVDLKAPIPEPTAWKEQRFFLRIKPRDLHDKLNTDERALLASSRHIDQIVSLLLVGLGRLKRPKY